ncbi:MAG: glycosyltransferase family 9 protein [Myxococcota bacterium]
MTLVVRSGALGDFVLSLPAIQALVPCDVACPARYGCLLPEGARRVEWDWRSGGWDRGVAFAPTAAQAMREAGIPEVFEIAPMPPEGVHAATHFGRAVGAVDLVPRVRARDDGSRRVVIAPGSGGAGKRWPMERWRAAAALLGEVAWVGGPVEEGEAWAQLRPDLPELVAILAGAAVVLAPDSGVGHLAAAVGAPVVSVFGPTDPRQWAPVGAVVVAWDTPPEDVAKIARARMAARFAADRAGDAG